MNRTRNLLWTTNTSAMEGIYHNSTLGLISVKVAGRMGVTMSDKNLGATVLWSDGDGYNTNNVGNWYQWGNDYGFTWLSSGYLNYTSNPQYIGPNTYSLTYNRAYFLNLNSCPYTGHYENLWGNNNSNKQGPCATGYHIPTSMELGSTLVAVTILGGSYADAYKIFHVPLAGVCYGTTRIDNISLLWSTGGLLKENDTVYAIGLSNSDGIMQRVPLYPIGYIRPFKDTYVKPDSTRTRIL